MILRLLFTLCLLSSLLYSQTNQTAQPTIQNIIIERHSLFSADEQLQNPVYRFINFLHPLTKEDIIKRELLFSEGDSIQLELVEESMRNLRKLNFIGDVSIKIDSLSLSKVNLVVTTHDKSTKGLRTNFNSTGGLNKADLGYKDSNLMGMGIKVLVNYNYRSDRKNPHGTKIQFDDKRIFNSYWRSLFQYKNAEELNIQTLLFERIFYRENANWAASIYGDKGKALDRIYKAGEVISEQSISSQNISSWFSKSWGSKHKIRPILFYSHNRSTAKQLQLLPFEDIDFVGIGFNSLSRKFKTVRFIDQMGRMEDQPTGYSTSFFIAPNVNRSSPTNYFSQIKLTTAFLFMDKFYSALDFSYIHFDIKNTPSNQTFGFKTHHYIKAPFKQTIGVRTSLLVSKNGAERQQIILGATTGLRGYSAFEFSGSNRFIGNIENRVLPELDWWIFKLGFVSFFDAGIVWENNERLFKQRLLSSIGLGVRIGNRKRGGNNTTRIDLAFNLNENKMGSVTVSSGHLFNLIMPIDFSTPTYKVP